IPGSRTMIWVTLPVPRSTTTPLVWPPGLSVHWTLPLNGIIMLPPPVSVARLRAGYRQNSCSFQKEIGKGECFGGHPQAPVMGSPSPQAPFDMGRGKLGETPKPRHGLSLAPQAPYNTGEGAVRSLADYIKEPPGRQAVSCLGLARGSRVRGVRPPLCRPGR